MAKKFTLSIVYFSVSFLYAQTATYNDVGVITNSNSSVSDSIGSYFVRERNIPERNIIRISAPATEEICDSQFCSLRSQIETYLTSAGIADSINYLVTTKGVPLKVKRGGTSAWSSVENELALILGSYASKIGAGGKIISPYYQQTEHFTRVRYGIYLVTRLDGYTFNDIKGIIDRASVIGEVISADAKFVFDMDPLWNPVLPSLNLNMSRIAQTLSSRGLAVELDSTTTYVTGRQNVIGYTSWGSNDKNASQCGRVYNTWAPGAIAETYVSTSGRCFNAPAQYGQSLIADLISEGITAAKGYVYEPYSTAMADVTVLFDRYTSGYTIAESFYSASPYLSWMDVVIGDPKYRLVRTRLPSDMDALPVELTSFTAMTSGKKVELAWQTATEVNNYGFAVERKTIDNGQVTMENWKQTGFVEGHGTSNSPRLYSFIDVTAPGNIVYRLKQIDNDGKFKYSNQVRVDLLQEPQAFALMQNHPNPFNPATEIRYQMSEVGLVSLNVFDMLGREVAVLVNEVKEAGEHTAEFNASQYPSGIYFYTLRTNNFTATKKMLLIK